LKKHITEKTLALIWCKYFILLSLFTVHFFRLFAQKEGVYPLPKPLKEISGFVPFNDTLFIGHNDSGNKPNLYLFDLKGRIHKTVKILGAKNVDWEDITLDTLRKTLYIADIGNNGNTRKSITIYQVKLTDFIKLDSINANVISLVYQDTSIRELDAESLSFHNDSLVIFSKCNFDHCSGTSNVYIVPAVPGSYTLKVHSNLNYGDVSYLHNAITSAFAERDTFYLLSYKHIFRYVYRNNQFKYAGKLTFAGISQKESLYMNSSYYFIADEKNKIFGGPNMHIIKREKNDFK
jgi:hypothetical protein